MTRAESLLVAAVQAHQAGDRARAAQGYRTLLQENPAHFEALQLLAVLCQTEGNAPEALSLVERAIALDARQPVLFCNRAIALLALERPREALASLDQALALAPQSVQAHHLRAAAFGQLGRHAEAADSLADLRAVQPDAPALRLEHANALFLAQRFKEALIVCETAPGGMPPTPELLNLRGCIRGRLLQPEAAIEDFRAALATDPDFTLACANLGRSLMSLQRLDEARACFNRVLRKTPDDADIHFARACCRLAQGELPAAWAEFEWRRRLPGGIDLTRRMDRPRWLGRQSLQGKCLLVCAEQGYGDAIQFIRFLPRLEALGARVVVELRRPLDPLLRQVSRTASWFAAGEAPPAHDLVCSSVSLGRALDLAWPDISGAAYLRADAQQAAHWATRLPPRRRDVLRVGLVWRGNPGHVNDHARSVSLQRLAPLLALEVEWFSVQKTLSAEDRRALADFPQVRSLDDQIASMADTAAILAGLDLLISVDGGVAHLGGAMGAPTWILLPFHSDWRWLQGRSDTPWYDSVRLFRQSVPGDWRAVVAELVAALGTLSVLKERQAARSR